MSLRIVNFGTSKGGLSTVGYTIYGVDGAVIASRSTSGVTEIGSSTGIYAANINMPDYDAIVLWDTGDASIRYATEDYQHQITSIENSVGRVENIYQSVKNIGEFMATIMDKLGWLEKNDGLKQVNEKIDKLSSKDSEFVVSLREEFKNAAANVNVNAPQVNIPEIKIPDYAHILSRIEGMMGTAGKNSGALSQLISSLKQSQERISGNLIEKSRSLSEQISKLQNIFSGLDSLLSMIKELKASLSNLDVNDKNIMKSKKEISDEIKRLNMFIYQLSTSKAFKEAQDLNNVLLSFGHKR